MSPILGIWASAQQPALQGSFDSIATVTVGSGGSSSITFSSIPSTYKHLQIRGIAKNGTTNGDTRTLMYQFNSDTTSGNYYARHLIYGDGSTADAAANTTIGSTAGAAGGADAPQASTSVFQAVICDILDYSNTNKYKTLRTLTGYDANGTGTITLSSSLWMSTSAISSITIVPHTDTLGQYSSFALYGVK